MVDTYNSVHPRDEQHGFDLDRHSDEAGATGATIYFASHSPHFSH